MCSEVWGHPDTGGLVGVAPRVTSSGAVASRQGSAINPDATPAPVIMLAKIPEEFLNPGCEPTAIAARQGRKSADHLREPRPPGQGSRTAGGLAADLAREAELDGLRRGDPFRDRDGAQARQRLDDLAYHGGRG